MHPDQVGWWLRVCRRDFNKVPPFPSLSEYQDFWITWWTTIQPGWRQVDRWPFPQASSTTSRWDGILLGGKDRLFIVIMSLMWWFIECMRVSEFTELRNTISDVSCQDYARYPLFFSGFSLFFPSPGRSFPPLYHYFPTTNTHSTKSLSLDLIFYLTNHATGGQIIIDHSPTQWP